MEHPHREAKLGQGTRGRRGDVRAEAPGGCARSLPALLPHSFQELSPSFSPDFYNIHLPEVMDKEPLLHADILVLPCSELGRAKTLAKHFPPTPQPLSALLAVSTGCSRRLQLPEPSQQRGRSGSHPPCLPGPPSSTAHEGRAARAAQAAKVHSAAGEGSHIPLLYTPTPHSRIPSQIKKIYMLGEAWLGFLSRFPLIKGGF